MGGQSDDRQTVHEFPQQLQIAGTVAHEIQEHGVEILTVQHLVGPGLGFDSFC